MENRDIPFTEILHTVRINGLRRIAEKVLEALSGSKKKVNYTARNCIITGWSFSTATNEDMKIISRFGEQFMKNTIETCVHTKQVFCRHTSQLFENHNCQHYEGNNSAKEGPSTEDDGSSSSQ